MRYLLLSDIHANDVAFEAVLRSARTRQWDKVLFLGDAVGYYPMPERCLELLMELEPQVCLLGNHDALLLELADGRAQPGQGEAGLVREVLERQLDALSSETLAFLRSFRGHVVDDGWEAVHGALRRPWEYLATLQSAQANAPLLQRSLCFVGHTHVPKIFASVATGQDVLWRTVSFKQERAVYRVPPRATLFFNPGSVGQPRDGIPLASYAVFDAEAKTMELQRVEFDLLAVARAVRESGYPEVLASRLVVGR